MEDGVGEVGSGMGGWEVEWVRWEVEWVGREVEWMRWEVEWVGGRWSG